MSENEELNQEQEGTEELVLSSDFVEIPVKLQSRSGVVQKYTLREFDGTVRDKWLNSMSSRMTIDGNGKTRRIKSFDGLYASLITLCLFNDEGKQVSSKEIQAMPSRIQKTLFDKCQKMNGLDDVAEDDAKND